MGAKLAQRVLVAVLEVHGWNQLLLPLPLQAFVAHCSTERIRAARGRRLLLRGALCGAGLPLRAPVPLPVEECRHQVLRHGGSKGRRL